MIFVFYDRFFELCEQAGVTPAKVAESIGVNKSTMYMWKKQGTTPKYATLQKLADYFQVSIESLLDYSDAEQAVLDDLADGISENLESQRKM